MTIKTLQPCTVVEHTVTDDGSSCLCGYFIQRTEQFKCPSYFDDDDTLQNCSCGKCS